MNDSLAARQLEIVEDGEEGVKRALKFRLMAPRRMPPNASRGVVRRGGGATGRAAATAGDRRWVRN